MDDKIAGEASRLAPHAQDVAAQLKLLAQQITDAAAASPAAPQAESVLAGAAEMYARALRINERCGRRGQARVRPSAMNE